MQRGDNTSFWNVINSLGNLDKYNQARLPLREKNRRCAARPKIILFWLWVRVFQKPDNSFKIKLVVIRNCSHFPFAGCGALPSGPLLKGRICYACLTTTRIYSFLASLHHSYPCVARPSRIILSDVRGADRKIPFLEGFQSRLGNSLQRQCKRCIF